MRHCLRITAVAGAAARFEVIDLIHDLVNQLQLYLSSNHSLLDDRKL